MLASFTVSWILKAVHIACVSATMKSKTVVSLLYKLVSKAVISNHESEYPLRDRSFLRECERNRQNIDRFNQEHHLHRALKNSFQLAPMTKLNPLHVVSGPDVAQCMYDLQQSAL
ncbi:hypothetical protein BJV82DRAFT_635892 [Fennellomyces sp. T-0311]|nr:hypothetical protein BJV82DRAFT_635892 [Fennellomyces sp. T-0311]